MAVLLEEDVLNVQLIQELRQQRNGLDHGRDGRLLSPVRPGIHGEALVQQQSPSTGQAIGQGSVPEYKDRQNSTQAPFIPQDS